MRALVIKVNLLVSFLGLTIDPDHSSFLAVLIAVGYFAASGFLFNYASDNGWLEKPTSDNLDS